MKKRYIVFSIVALLFLITLASFIPAWSITGQATNLPANVSIVILPGASPTLSLLSPENKTYLYNQSILLNYTSTSADSIFYSLDSQTNVTINSNVLLNASQGNHSLFLYASNAFGEVSANVNFVVNSTKILMNFSEYKGSYKGNSTNFTNYTYEEIQNLSNVTIENTNYGKILFNEKINLTNDENPSDNVLELDNNINISSNRIEINSTALSNFNRTATLWLYGLTFSDPRILRDGDICPSTICTEESYSSSSGILKFNVTSFSVYSSEETPTTPGSPGGGTGGSGGGGGGGAAITQPAKFSVEQDLIQVIIKKGGFFKTSIKVKNTDAISQKFSVDAGILKDFVYIKESEFTLKAGEEKNIDLVFSAIESIKEDTYTGKIKISGSNDYKEVPVILSIKSAVLLFDLTVTIPTKYKEVKPGEEIALEVSAFNLGEEKNASLEMVYYIKNFNGNIIVNKTGAVIVDTQASFLINLKLPENISNGQYIAGANLKYKESIATASDVFNVNKTKISISYIYLILIAAILIVLIIIAIFIAKHYTNKLRKAVKTHVAELNGIENRIKRGHLKMAEEYKLTDRLNLRLSLLAKAYEKGFIKKEAYENGRKRINQVKAKLRKKYL